MIKKIAFILAYASLLFFTALSISVIVWAIIVTLQATFNTF